MTNYKDKLVRLTKDYVYLQREKEKLERQIESTKYDLHKVCDDFFIPENATEIFIKPNIIAHFDTENKRFISARAIETLE